MPEPADAHESATPPPATPARSGSSAHAAPQLVLSFDFGWRRIGCACGDTVSRTARPLAVVVNSAGGPRWERLDFLVREWRPALIVVGLPYHVDGSESVMSTAARAFAVQLENRYGLTVRLVDERYSSLDAQARLQSERESGMRKHRVEKSDIDAAAACVILERWFSEAG